MPLFHSQRQSSLTARLLFQNLKTPQLNTLTSALTQEHQHVTAASGAEISTHLTKKALKETETLFINCAFASENWKWAFAIGGHTAPLFHT